MTIVYNKPTITTDEYNAFEVRDGDYKVTCPVPGCAADASTHISDDVVVHSTKVTRLSYVKYSADFDTNLGIWTAVVDVASEGLVNENLVEMQAELSEVIRALAELNGGMSREAKDTNTIVVPRLTLVMNNELIESLRAQYGIETVADLADVAGIPADTLAAVKNRTQEPSLEFVARIACAFPRVPLDQLFLIEDVAAQTEGEAAA